MSAAVAQPWWLGLPAAQAALACGGQMHRLRWECGELRALDHEDAEAERTLAVLSDERCACIETLDAWARHSADLRVLVLASRGPADPLGAQRAQRRTGGLAFVPHARAVASAGRATPPPGIADTPEDELASLLSLGGGLPERLVATVAAAWVARLREDDATGETQAARAQLEAALYGRATAAVRSWLAQPEQGIELRMIDADGVPTLAAGGGGLLLAELPFSWLLDVFAKGLAVTWGRFCLAASSADGCSWTLATLTADLAPAQPLIVQLPASQ